MAEIDEAIDRRIAGPAKSGKGMNDQERKEVAFHEAGHAVIGLVFRIREGSEDHHHSARSHRWSRSHDA
jgi:ATP-dependent Zn protease